ncbi:MAG: DsbA family protein [Pirellulaceae bacterium]
MNGKLVTKSVSILLLTLGLAVSGYLLYRHFLLIGETTSSVDFCSAYLGHGCDETLQSDWAVLLGLPLAGWGLVYYGTLLALLLLGWSVGAAFEFEATVAAWVVSLVGAAGSIFLLLVMLDGHAPMCPLCMVVHAINIVLVFPLKQLTGQKMKELFHTISAGLWYVFGAKAVDPQQARWRMVGFLSVGLVAVVLYQWVYVEHALQTSVTQGDFDANETLELYETLEPQNVTYDDEDAQWGDPLAPLHLVIYSDFQCPGCTRFARTLNALRNRFGEHLHVVFKHFPLDGTCNRLIQTAVHPRACEAAAAAESARRQDRFWEFHDAVFAADLSRNTQASLDDVAQEIGLDPRQFEADRGSESVKQAILADIETGIELGLDGTPAVFLNGRRMYDLRLQAVEFIVAHELEHHSHELSVYED